MESLEAHCVIVGAGAAGCSTAYHLALEGVGPIVLLDREASPGAHSTGRNAAMARQLVGDADLTELARRGVERLRMLSAAWGRELLRPTGSLLLLERESPDPWLKRARAAGIGTEAWEPERVVEAAPLAEGGAFTCGLWTASDGVVDVAALIEGFISRARSFGVRLLCGQPVERIEHLDGGGFLVVTKDLQIRSPRVVNAGGAWAGEIGRLAGATPIRLTPYRRHLVLGSLPREVPAAQPFVWHLERGIYFRPESGGLLLSPCDETPAPPGVPEVEPEVIEELARKLEETFPRLKDLEVRTAWAGLRTFAPDRTFVIGRDPRLEGFYWAAGLGGHGITTAAAAGALAARRVLEDGPRAAGAPFSPARFAQGGEGESEAGGTRS